MMNSTTIEADKRLTEQLDKIKARYTKEGQSVACHLERLLYEKNLDYDDYLHLDTLLSLQKPRTYFPDEFIFIVYHQIVELYFQLMLWELRQLTDEAAGIPAPPVFIDKVKRLNRYFEVIISSWVIMMDGLNKNEFLKFRYALFPASGFQSLQYRLIEIFATDAINLVSAKWRPQFSKETALDKLYQKSYWKRGAMDTATDTKSITLTDFEKKHDAYLLQNLRERQDHNLYKVYLKHCLEAEEQPEIAAALRDFDRLANIQWPDAHLKVVMKYLGHNGPVTTKSTGGTNWRKYLNPRFQRIVFFPGLWSARDLENWGHPH